MHKRGMVMPLMPRVILIFFEPARFAAAGKALSSYSALPRLDWLFLAALA